MKAVTILASLWGVSKSVEILAGEDVCFMAPGYHVGYEFSPPVDGEIYGIRLVHKEGSVTCKSSSPGTNWGCANTNLDGDVFGVQMVEVGGSTYYPTDLTDGVGNTYDSIAACPNECDLEWYKLNQGVNDDEILLVDGDATYQVTTGQDFSLQYGEGCCLTSTSDNNGESCADVYFLYNETTTTPSPTDDDDCPNYDSSCPPDTVNERNYVVPLDDNGDFITRNTMFRANQYCIDRYGTSLATVITEAEANKIASLAATYNPSQSTFYIGLYDRNVEGTFEWIDGTCCEINDGSGLCTSLWEDGEPKTNGGPDCVSVIIEGDGSGMKRNIICPTFTMVVCNEPCPFIDNFATTPSPTDDDCDKFIYVDDPKSFDDAQAYCESEYGTSLAGVNEVDIPDANCVITDPGEPTWVGLYSETDPAFFEFVSGEDCDIPFSGACVDFWGTFSKGNTGPQCLKEGGYQCGYYRESSELVYNNLDCETEAPFLCENPASSSAHYGLFSEIKDVVDDGVNGNYSDKKNLYFVIGTALLGLIVVIFTIGELIYCLYYAKKEKTKTIYDKLGSEHESEEAGVVKHDI